MFHQYLFYGSGAVKFAREPYMQTRSPRPGVTRNACSARLTRAAGRDGLACLRHSVCLGRRTAMPEGRQPAVSAHRRLDARSRQDLPPFLSFFEPARLRPMWKKGDSARIETVLPYESENPRRVGVSARISEAPIRRTRYVAMHMPFAVL